MYHNILPATGMATALWLPLAAFALIALGIALVRMAGTFRKDDDEGGS